MGLIEIMTLRVPAQVLLSALWWPEGSGRVGVECTELPEAFLIHEIGFVNGDVLLTISRKPAAALPPISPAKYELLLPRGAHPPLDSGLIPDPDQSGLTDNLLVRWIRGG